MTRTMIRTRHLDMWSVSGDREVARYLAVHMGAMNLWDGVDVTPCRKSTWTSSRRQIGISCIANHPNIFGGLGKTWLHEQHDASAKVGVKVGRSLLDEGADVDEQ